MNPNRRDHQLCAALPCCHFNTNPYDPGFGLCWSSVGDEPCYGPPQLGTPQHPTSGEDVCQRMNTNRRDHQLCAALPCCHFNANPYDPGFGLCWSIVGDGPCYAPPQLGTPQHPTSGEDVCQ